MNIDDLKNAWNEDVSDETPEISIENKNKINLPLEKIRKNMRMEFWSTIAILIFGFAVVWIPVPEAPFKFKFYLTVLLASMVIVISFFFSKFFKLYKDISNPMLKTYDSLKDLMYQFDLNKQYYLSFMLSFVPFLVCELIIVVEFLPHREPLSDLHIAVTVISALALGLFGLLLLGKYWYRIFYGRYVQQIENLLNELRK
ncbi:hypothetical protein CHRY9390_02498 [Chryseobacterium aquaeductus]|uniref:Uncharacterized protein n=1 Tax=Chryseobacterium aquaeductus TaxID=2675056 RepID=A0A9N8QSV7_9FLAO|nr:hypothetical protein [Chryseobacterium aquaeductus]CAA7331782.1 hypothetical protein CHRY9390_02498 [Chryseobacterium potabilaquae]CAD7812338.1 hypothetical protein CHRY9390_02498 [Chryseobacterium aquaeductus]